MAFSVKVTSNISTRVVLEYQWATTPNDNQITEVVKESALFAHGPTITRAICYLRDESGAVSCMLTSGFQVQVDKYA